MKIIWKLAALFFGIPLAVIAIQLGLRLWKLVLFGEV
jgi:hypothetical protein